MLPGKGVRQHPFLYAGQWDTRRPDEQSIFLVKRGKVVWRYSIPLRTPDGRIQEFSDISMLRDGRVLFARMSGAGMLDRDKRLLWEYAAPAGTEVHSIQSLENGRVLIMRNGSPAAAMIIDVDSGRIEKEIAIPTGVVSPHGQFRHVRMTRAGTLLVPHLGEGKVVEYDLEGRELWTVLAKSPWQAVRLANGNTLIAGDKNRYAREVDPAGRVVWEFTSEDAPGYTLGNIQTASRLANGNTVMCLWAAGEKDSSRWPGTVQVLEVTPAKAIVWALSSWDAPDLGPATSIQLLDDRRSLQSQER